MVYLRSAGRTSGPIARTARIGLTAFAALLALRPASAQGPAASLSPLPVTTLERLTTAAPQPAPEAATRMASRAELDGPRTVSVAMARPTPVRAVLQLLFGGTPFSTVVHGSIKCTFAGELRNLSLRQALEAVLFPSDLDYDVRGTVIRVFPRRPATRLFTIDLLAVRRSWETRSGPSSSAVVSRAASDALSEIDTGVRTLLSKEGRHHVDRRAGIVHVTDFAERLDQVGLYLEAVQLRATRQVRVDVSLLRVLLNDGAAMPGLPAVVHDLDRFLGALKAAGTVEIIGSPRLLAMNNEPAIVHVASGDGAESSVVVTPQVSADGFIQLSVAPRLVDPPGAAAGGQRQSALSASDWLLRVREGETVVVSGLPYSPAESQRAGIVVLLTPTVVSFARQAGQR